jgi:hypothetical protein
MLRLCARFLLAICAACLLAMKPVTPTVSLAQATTPDQAAPITEISQLAAAVYAVGVRGNIAVIGDDRGVQLLDISDPAQPFQISRLELGGSVYDLQIVGTLVYAANYGGSLQIIDIDNPFAPRLLSNLTVPGSPSGIDVADGRAAVAAFNSGVLLVDVRNPDAPLLLATSDPRLTGSVLDVQLAGNRIYSASLGGMQIFDTTAPTSGKLELLGAFNTISSGFGNGRGVHVVGNRSYLAVGADGLVLLDVSDPAALHVVGSVDTPGFALTVEVVGNRAYIAAREGGLEVVDVSTPTQPRLVGQHDTPRMAERLMATKGLVYLADEAGGLLIIDVRTDAPVRRGTYNIAGNTTDVVVLGDRVYLSTFQGLVVGDVSIPARPQVLGTLALPGFSYNITISDTIAFVNNGSQVCVIDVAEPTRPRLLQTIPFTADSLRGLALRSTTLYVATANQGLQLIDVADPLAPVRLGAVSGITNTYISSIVMSGARAYLGSGEILDVTVPQAPVVLGQLNLRESPLHAVVGDLAYTVYTPRSYNPRPFPPVTGTLTSTLTIVDTRVPTATQLMGRYQSQTRITSVSVRNATAYLLTPKGVELVDVSNPLSPTLRATIPLSSTPETLLANDKLFFGTGYRRGLGIYTTSSRFVQTTGEADSALPLTNADNTVTLRFDEAAASKPTFVAQFDRLTPSQAASKQRAIARSFIVEARDTTGAIIPQAQQPYTLTIAMPTVARAAGTSLGVAFWNGTNWVDVASCANCGQGGQLTVRTASFGEFALVTDAPTATTPQVPTTTPLPSPQPTTPSPNVPSDQQPRQQRYLPLLQG